MGVDKGGGGRGIGESGGDKEGEGGGVKRDNGRRGESEGEETTEVWRTEEE